MANLFSWIWKPRQPSEKMADDSKKASGLGMADDSKKASGLGVKPGALIKISRKHGLYEDWALCVAENEVIHIDLQSPTKHIFKQEKLEKVVGSDQWCVNTRLDEIYDRRDVQRILEEARKLKDTEVPYNLLTNNCEHMVTDWTSGKPKSFQVKPGDMIEISRLYGLYQHWALCVGENEVIHIVLEPPTKHIFKQDKLEEVVGSDKWCLNNSLDKKNEPRDVSIILEEAWKMKVPYHLCTRHSLTKAMIRQEKLEDVVRSYQWRVNNSLDEIYHPRDIQVILEEARKLKDTEVPYNLFTNNCEHMVTNLRYGKPESRQVQVAIIYMLVTGVIIMFIGLAACSLKKPSEKRLPGRRQFTGMGFSSSTTGPEEEKGDISKEEHEPTYTYAYANRS